MKTENILTGWDTLDKHLSESGGFKRGELTVLAGRPMMGKTTLMWNLFYHLHQHNIEALLLDLENNTDVSNNIDILKTTVKTKNEWKITEKFIAYTKDYLINNLDCLQELQTYCREKRPEVIIIDYLQLLYIDGQALSRLEQMSIILQHLQQLAKELNCVIIVVSQLHRSIELRADKRPKLSDFPKDYNQQYVDNILFLYDDSCYRTSKLPKCREKEIIIAKSNYQQGKIVLCLDSTLCSAIPNFSFRHWKEVKTNYYKKAFISIITQEKQANISGFMSALAVHTQQTINIENETDLLQQLVDSNYQDMGNIIAEYIKAHYQENHSEFPLGEIIGYRLHLIDKTIVFDVGGKVLEQIDKPSRVSLRGEIVYTDNG